MGKDKLLNELKTVIAAENILTAGSLAERYDHIWRMDIALNALAVVLPQSTQELSSIMKICHKFGQPVVLHGGLTNLVGATETKPDELVISLERMNKIEELDEGSRTMTVQAGVILENIQEAAKEKDMLFPLNFGAKGSAQMGGIISTLSLIHI